MGIEEASIAFAPRLNTGRNSLRYTFSVVRVLVCPTKCAMSSIGIPALDSSETKLCRSSRGVHASAWSPASSATWRKGTPNVGCVERGAKLRREDKIVVGPSCRVAHATLGLPASVRSKCDDAILREFEGAPRHSRLGVPALAYRSPQLHARRLTVEVRMAPGQRARNSSVRAPVSKDTTM